MGKNNLSDTYVKHDELRAVLDKAANGARLRIPLHTRRQAEAVRFALYRLRTQDRRVNPRSPWIHLTIAWEEPGPDCMTLLIEQAMSLPVIENLTTGETITGADLVPDELPEYSDDDMNIDDLLKDWNET